MSGPFPNALLRHAVSVYRRTTAITDGAAVESAAMLGTGPVACLISEVSSSRGQNDQDGAVVLEATLTGVNPLLAEANVRFVVVRGPFAAGVELFPAGGQSPHGADGIMRDFYRFRVSTVAPG